MQLFAIIAKVDEQEEGEFQTEGEGRRVVKAFLNQELDAGQVEEYLSLFDEFLTKHQGAVSKKGFEASVPIFFKSSNHS